MRLPDLVLKRDNGTVYLNRWWVLPRNRFLNLYLHQFLASDDDRALHDHPWWFISVILKHGYWEHIKGKGTAVWHGPGSILFRRAKHSHRVELDTKRSRLEWDEASHSWFPVYDEIPAWTFILTGPKVRSWGFWCPQGWIHWKRFDMKNGCGEK